MILAYRYIPYVHLNTKVPELPLVTFEDTLSIRALATTSMDVIEPIWNKNFCITISLDYDDMEVYYFLLPANLYYPNTDKYRRLQLEIAEAPLDHHCDYYAKALILRFVERLNRRLRTRRYLEAIQKAIPYPPTEMAYHQQFIDTIHIDSLESDQYELFILRQHYRESLLLVRDEKELRPNEKRVANLKQDFEELALLMKPI